jgi:hypothetical protein
MSAQHEHEHEMKVNYHPSHVIRRVGDDEGFTPWAYYDLEFKGTVTIPATEDFDSEMYRRAFIEAMENIAKLEAK